MFGSCINDSLIYKLIKLENSSITGFPLKIRIYILYRVVVASVFVWRSDTTFFLDPHLLQNSLFVILGTACQVSTKFGKSILEWRGIQSNTSKEPCPFPREDDSESTLTTYKKIFFYRDIGPILRNLVINRDSKFFKWKATW